ncbi:MULTISPECIES: methylated-DNA--[protein]-cysteine S-methyltransferase [unclassified Acidisoma]|jgi:AraC family transcriptional regulator of adaptative response/methylated-DNA-[protein]-cysteine methyltransferase|uniref:methylated-DNA--[protein]-cysteine S-methyltransferase n=1 Tax=unclassified Acidisoma TaxID=2634065 RepID=UPI00131DE563|nr:MULTISPECIES: methylated-DNA--[protein]-cysteine S-methyltransferase [unclassified Acidisoma]
MAITLNDVLHYGFGETAIGTVLVAVSGVGIACILVGDDKMRLRHELGATFPGADFAEDQAMVTDALVSVIKVMSDPRTPLDAALDIRGSDAERAVWSALRAIPAGETRTYGQIAKTLPMPMTALEVGAACSANVLAVAIPCHRVIKADGSLSGYRWGVGRKRRLLQMEAAA